MMSIKYKSMITVAWLAALAAGLTGCAATQAERVVRPGDKVALQFTCRFPNGDLAAATNPALADDPAVRKSPVFIVKKDNEPVKVTAGQRIANPVKGQGLEFEYAIADRLAELTVGRPFGEWWSSTVTAERMPVRDGEQQTLELALVRVRPKEIRLAREEFCMRSECGAGEPRVGQPFMYDPEFHGTVTEASDREVVVRISPPPGGEIETAFGKGTVRELPDRYEIPLDVKVGRLVRMGGLLGVISGIGEKTFTVDFSHSFGGESLQCDARVEPDAVSPAVSNGGTIK